MSEDRRSLLVDDLIETQPQLANFVRTRPNDLIAGSWDLLSYSFQQGFELMWDHAQAQSSGVLTRPLLSLWRQRVELALKSAITEISGGFSRKLGHDLESLFAELLVTRAQLGHDDEDDLAHRVMSMIGLIQSLDPFADRFRYPEGRNGQPFEGIDVDLDQLFQAHWIIVTWCEGAAIEAREARGPA